MYKSLIIGGTNKAGTTSVFEYLKDHPEVKGSFIKQTFFFLDKNLQENLKLHANYDYREGLDNYLNYFPGEYNGEKYYLEASPDYLYGNESPNLIYDFFKEKKGSKILFILREPVSRFLSFFNYAKQQGLIDKSMSVQEFYELSKNYTNDTNSGLRAHKTGFYSNYIKNYLKLFPKQDILFYFFEDLESDPKAFMQNLATDLAIDSSYYNHYDFQIKNKTSNVRNQNFSKLFRYGRAWYMKNLFSNPLGVKFANFLRNNITPLYRKLNLMEKERIEINETVINSLRDDYSFDKIQLENLIGKKLPWK